MKGTEVKRGKSVNIVLGGECGGINVSNSPFESMIYKEAVLPVNSNINLLNRRKSS